MSNELSDSENVGVGVTAAFLEAILLQPTLYWKNARAQGLPFTLDPRIVYRGTFMSVINEMQMMGVQFGCTGWLQRMWLTYISSKNKAESSKDHQFSLKDEMGLAFVGGAISALPTTPVELIMIQQQRSGDSMMKVINHVLKNHNIVRGMIPCICRDSVYTTGLLGVTPYTQEYLMNHGGLSQSMAGLCASVVGGIFSATLSHPTDVIKTCMQGDIEKSRFQGMSNTANVLIKQGGIGMLFKGLMWRSINIIGTVFIANQVRVSATEMLIKRRADN